MSAVGFGPWWPIDGPLPNPQVYGLLAAAAAPAAGVTIIEDVDAEQIQRWINGVKVRPYPVGPAKAWNACAPASEFVDKDEGTDIPLPEFGAMTIYLPISCTSYQVPDQQAFKARAVLTLTAVESFTVAREFLSGDVLPLNPHLADGNGTFPNGNTVTSPLNALGLLEKEIAASGQLGLVHMSPQMATVLRAQLAIDDKTGVLRTINGNVIIQDDGYAAGASPKGAHTPASGTKEWMYATGTVEIRRSPIFTTPDNVSEALSRGTGGAGDTPNNVTYRAERYELIDWDTQTQAAVFADRCMSTC